jgi:DNA replication protein DnaC
MNGLGDALAGMMNAAEQNAKRQMREDDYVADDGLIHCGKCHKARQTRISLFGMEQTVWCICDCRKAEIEKIEADKRKDRIDLLKRDGFHDPTMAGSTFEQDDAPDSENSVMCRNYVTGFERFYHSGKGLLLTGGVGTGKTFYASCIANALMDKLHPVLVTSIGRFIRGMENEFGGRNEKIAYLDRFDLVVFDDFGVERNTPYSVESIYAIIDSRIRSGKPMVITTNIPLSALKETDNIDLARIYDRIISKCIPIVFSGSNMRRKQIKETYADDVSFLKGECNS